MDCMFSYRGLKCWGAGLEELFYISSICTPTPLVTKNMLPETEPAAFEYVIQNFEDLKLSRGRQYICWGVVSQHALTQIGTTGSRKPLCDGGDGVNGQPSAPQNR